MNKKIIILYDFKLYDSHWMIKELKKKGYTVEYLDAKEIDFKKIKNGSSIKYLITLLF